MTESLGRIRSRLSRLLSTASTDRQTDALALRAMDLLQQDLEAGDPALLDKGIAMLREALSRTTSDHPFYAERHNNLATALLRRARYADAPADITEAVEALRRAVAAAPPDDPERAMYLGNLSGALTTRFAMTGDAADLDAAVEASEQAYAGMPADYPDPGFFLSALAQSLLLRYQVRGSEQDLDRGVELCEQALALAPEGHPDRPNRQNNTMRALGLRFRATGSVADADRSIALGEQAAAAIPPANPDRVLVLMNLSVMLASRFERTGNPADLDRAVKAGEQGAAAAAGHLSYEAIMLTVLGAALRSRFETTGSLADLNRAVQVSERAVAVSQPSQPDHPALLSLLSVALARRAERTGSLADLDRAIEVSEQAVAAAGPGHPRHVLACLNLVLMLGTRFGRTGQAADLDRAIDIAEQVLGLKDTEAADRAKVLSALSLALVSRSRQTGTADLDRAIGLAEQAVTATPADHPDRAAYLLLLDDALRARADTASQPTGTSQPGNTRQPAPAPLPDTRRALAACREAAAVPAAPAWMRASAAARWGHWAAAEEDWQQAVDGFALAVGLLGVVAPRGLDRRDQEHELVSLTGVGSLAAACCLQAGQPQHAVELWEHGRAVLLNQTLDTRTDLTELAQREPALAERFIRLRDLLDRPLAASTAYAGPAEGVALAPPEADRRQVAAEFNDVLDEIRRQPGFGSFLLPPSFNDLAATADHGPVVVINVTDIRSDALILQRERVVTVPLPGLSPAAAQERTDAFQRALDAAGADDPDTRVAAEAELTSQLNWLWDAVAGPVLDRLGATAANQPDREQQRLWWCPSGALAFLPLHAAGYHESRFDNVPRTVVDQVVSSYLPTVRSLSYTRRPASPPAPGGGRALVVAMPHTPDAADLPAATDEARLLSEALGTQARVLTPPEATRDTVTAAMREYPWAHFACHGDSKLADPSASRLLLQDYASRPLTVLDVIGLRLDGAEFAYLSACSTARTGAQLPDEAIHLAAAFHLAGYRHVIGTLWPTGDRAALAFATGTYPVLLADRDASRAASTLHDTIVALRLIHAARPSVWAGHIHLGG
jgi:tetratricopeptide (TPR) repeat protein